jgi:hypothetical protein
VLVHIQFDSQVRKLAECNRISIKVDEAASLAQVIQRVAAEGTESLRAALLDDEKVPRSSLLVFMNNELVANNQFVSLHDGVELTLTTLISGG